MDGVKQRKLPEQLCAVNMIRKGQVSWLPKDDIVGNAAFGYRLLATVMVRKYSVRALRSAKSSA